MRCRFGLFEFDARSHELRREGIAVRLSPQPARVLALLLSRPGEVVLREELRAHIWGDDTFVDFERGLNFSVQQVRAALGDSADAPRYVQTVPRRGYRFIAPLTVHAPAGLEVQNAPSRAGSEPARNLPSSEGSDSVRSPALNPASRDGSDLAPDGANDLEFGRNAAPARMSAFAISRRVRPLALAVGALMILAPVGWLATTTRSDANVASGVQAARLRIAVLPFANLTGDGGADYLADGLTDELIAELGRVSPTRLAVIARTSVMAYRAKTTSLVEIAKELNVSHVIEGSIHATADGLRVDGRLIPVSDQTAIATWSDDYARDGATAIRLARDAALRLLPEATAPHLPRPTSNPAAWDAYLRGRQRLNAGTVDGVRGAIADFEQAVRLDPSFAGGWAQLAEAQHTLVMIGAARPLDAYAAAAEAAERALGLDPTLADAHVARGLVQLWHEWKAADAADSFARALALNGSHAAAHHDYAWSLVALGRDEDAIAHITIARDLDPLSARANTDIGWMFLHLRRPADATRACRRTLAIHPQSLEAQACLERVALQRTAPDAQTRAAWRNRLRALEQTARTRWVSPYTVAVHELLAGESERAMDHLEAAAEERVGMLVLLRRDPAVDALRRSPRFAALLQRITGSSE